MSHCVKMDIVINDLVALQAAAAELGLEFRQGQKTYRWWGHSVGDYPIPEGVKEEDLGHCDHALSVKGNNSAYEVGVVANKDGTFGLLWDFFAGGYGLQEKIGQNGSKLKQAYTKHKVLREAARNGLIVEKCVELANGNVQLTLRD